VDNCYVSLDRFTGSADVVIDFSNHAATETLVSYCVSRGFALVIATTGQTEEELAMIHEAAKKIPVFYSANMSIGVALVADLAKKAAATFPNADIEIIEKHHNQKLDVPSGTALLLANKIREARPEAVYNVGRHEYGKRTKEEIGIHSLRLGGEVGTHEIIIATGTETITIKHEAESRTLFADGAMTAAAFISGKPAGLYTMQDIIA
ncbi:MAG: 4-hydroxy-tetrahydrodipicolinate reductase, partial [Oscillospiraceae bacterium]|nr:4-hydroxy-tetrahydrodipicolinate reductase [Oscillospiraceae bacterium]